MSTVGLSFPNIDKAIAQFEGFGKANTTPTILHNPGDLIYGSFAVTHGATGQQGGFAVFPNDAVGASAEDALVSYYSKQGATIGSLINSWAPPTAPGNSADATNSYAQFVADQLGVSTSTLLSDAEKGQQGTTPTTGTGNSTLDSIVNGLGSVFSPFPGIDPIGKVKDAINGTTGPTGVWGRVAALVLGLILIGVAIALFKPVSQVIVKSVKGAATRAL